MRFLEIPQNLIFEHIDQHVNHSRRLYICIHFEEEGMTLQCNVQFRSKMRAFIVWSLLLNPIYRLNYPLPSIFVGYAMANDRLLCNVYMLQCMITKRKGENTSSLYLIIIYSYHLIMYLQLYVYDYIDI